MKQKWLSWLKTSQLILLLIILFSCSKKNKYPKMKTGYYQLIEVNSYTNGSIETINRIVLGPEILDETNFVVSFFYYENGNQYGYNFFFNSGASGNSIINSNYDDDITFDPISYTFSETEIEFVRKPNDTDTVISKINLKYIE